MSFVIKCCLYEIWTVFEGFVGVREYLCADMWHLPLEPTYSADSSEMADDSVMGKGKDHRC